MTFKRDALARSSVVGVFLQNAFYFIDGKGTLICSMPGGNDEFAFCTFQVRTAVAHDTIRAIGRISATTVTHDAVIWDAFHKWG